MDLSLPLQEKPHSIHLNSSWKDQGWGNRKGRVVVTSSIYAFTPDIVVNSWIAEHRLSQLELKVQPGKKYYLMYRAGGGGGHSLHVSDITLKFLIHVAGVAKMHNSGFADGGLQRALLEAAASSFETAVENGRDADRHLELVLRRFGFPALDRETIDNLRDMARLMGEKNETVEVFQDSTGAVESDSEDFDY
jgi:hypothetical protein